MRAAIAIAISLLLNAVFSPRTGAGEIDIEAGKRHWAYQPVIAPAVPAVIDHRWPRGTTDRFLLARMEAAGIKPVADAGALTLLRRATFDLTGLPPTPLEISEFLSDCEQSGTRHAFTTLVERLLASPAYGERWGRHWLDVVRYADTSGSSSDHPVPEAHLYRDYVIAAFNKDTPYDQFVREQLAGDLAPAENEAQRREQIIATGYLAGAQRFGVSGKEAHLTIEDVINNFGDAFLATSIGCARCHDHMHDAVPAADYYALYGFFQSTRFPFPGSENQKTPSDLVLLSGDNEKRRGLERESERLGNEIKSLKREVRDKKKPLGYRLKLAGLTLKQRDAKKKLSAFDDFAYAVAEGKAGDAGIHAQGNPSERGETVRRGFLQVLGGQMLPEETEGSGRLQLAEWLTARDNPLFARVMVNRVWALHFGRGLVNTPNDFGTHGDTPSHPALLDHLASEFIADGYSMKNLHRRIMGSRAYQLASDSHTDNQMHDPNARLRWRFERRRLSAEELRDAMLAASGMLDREPGGAHAFPPQEKWNYSQHNPFYASYDHDKRSIYLMQQRIRKHPVLSVFDGADTTTSTPLREQSNSPVQSLYLMNAPFANETAIAFAGRMLSNSRETAEQIDLAHRFALGRPAHEEDIKAGQYYLEEAAKTLSKSENTASEASVKALVSYVKVLFCSNEFLYVD